MHPVDFPALFLRRPRQDFMMGVFTAHLFWGGVGFAQRSSTSFGLSAETRLDASPSSIVVSTPRASRTSLILVGSSTTSQIQKFRMTGDGRLESAGRIQGPFPVCQLSAIPATGSHDNGIVALSADGYRVGLVGAEGSWRGGTITTLDQRAERFIISDINNDGLPDILLFGRTMSGVATVSITRHHLMKTGPVLFPDLSVSDMAALDMNGDQISDVALCHWLSNRLIVRFGIGQGVFSNQSSLDLPSEPDRLSITTVSHWRTMRMLVTLPESRAVAHLTGFPSGELAVREILPMPHQPTSVRFALINDDALPDMICSTEGGYIVALGASTYSFAGQVQFGAGADAVSWAADDVQGDGLVDLAFVEGSRKLVVLSNARTSQEERTRHCYATGASPIGLLLHDFDDDGLIDVATANRGSSSISVFYNRGDGDLDGQQSIEVPHAPESLHLLQPRGGMLVVDHPNENMISLVHLPDSDRGSGAVAIPTGAHPQVVLAQRSTTSDRIRVLLQYRDTDDARAPFAVVEQFGSKQYTERSFRWPPHLTVAALVTGSISGNPQGDLVLALRDGRSPSTSIVLAPPLDGFDYRRFVTTYRVPDSIGIPQFLACGQINSDTCEDVAVITGAPFSRFGVLIGTTNYRLAPPQYWMTEIRPSEQQPVLLTDADGDGATDIVYLDRSNRAVNVLYGRGNGEFSRPTPVLIDGEISSIAVAPLFVGSANDLVTTNRQNHTVTVHRGVFHR
jgi:hypothetical protein